MDLQKGLVGHWTLDRRDIDDGVCRDRSGHGHHGNLDGADVGEEGLFGEALGFDGDNGNVKIESDKSLEHDKFITYTFWYRLEREPNGTWFGVVSKSGDAGRHFGVLDEMDDRGFAFSPYVDGDRNKHDIDIPSDNFYQEWNHFAFVFNGEEGVSYIYMNGELESVDEGATTGELEDGPEDNLNISDPDHVSEDDNTFKGRIADVRIYNRALNKEQIQKIYNMRSNQVQKA